MSADALAAQENDREIVAERSTLRVGFERLDDPVEDFSGGRGAMRAHGLEHAFLAEPLARTVARIAHAIGEQHEEVAPRVPSTRRRGRGALVHAERRIAR